MFVKTLFDMAKEEKDQNVPMETHRRIRKANRSRDMMSVLEGWIAKLDGFVVDTKESLEIVEGCTLELDSMRNELDQEIMLL